jgi:hypothetical protein
VLKTHDVDIGRVDDFERSEGRLRLVVQAGSSLGGEGGYCCRGGGFADEGDVVLVRVSKKSSW